MPTLTTSKTGEDAANTDWPIHFESVSWAYESPTFKAKFKAPYRLSKLLQSQANDDDIGALERDLELNNELVGVAAAVDVLCAYEENSGFHYKFGGDHSEPVSDISREIDDDNVVLSRENWDDMTQNLTGDFSEDGSDSSSLASSLVLDSSDWEMPSTPKPPFLSPSQSSPSRLSASASSFTPSLTFSAATKSSPSPPVPDFVFPSLNSSYPKLKIEKDEQGFFTNIKTDADEVTPKSRMHSSSLLPAFLQDDSRRKTSSSRTRTLVDKLRSKQSTHDRSGYSPSPSPVSDGESSKSRSLSRCSTPPPVFFVDNQDGWIGIDDSPPQAHKSHSRHHRTESGSVATEIEMVDHSPSSPLSQTGTSSSSSTSSSDSWSSMPRTPPAANKDGWISLPSAQTKRGKKKAEKVASMSAANALDILTFPSLNDKPPSASSARPSRSRTRSSSAKPKSTAPVMFPPAPAPAPYYPYPAVAIPVAVAYTMAPMVPYPAIQYHRTPHHAYPHQPQQPHTHPQPSHHYPAYHHHSRALAVPPPTMPGYASKPPYMLPNPSPMMPGVW